MSRSYSLSFTAMGLRAPAHIVPGVLPGPTTQTLFTGTAGNDGITGTGGDDQFDIFQGGNDVAKGRGGDDTFNLGAAFTAADRIEGGADSGDPALEGRDRILLNGDYSAGIVFTATTMTGVEAITLNAGHSYNFTLHGASVAPDSYLFIQGASLGAGDNLTVNGAAAIDGNLLISGGAGVDKLIGGAGFDQFYFNGAAFGATDRLDGGAGSNQITLTGGCNVTLDAATIKNIYSISMFSGADYSLTFVDANVDAGRTMFVNGGSLASGALTFDGSLERDGFFDISGGDGDDALSGGRLADVIHGGQGGDTLTGGNGADTYHFADASDSTSTHYDTIVGFDFAATDHFSLSGTAVGAIDKALNTGRLALANFDTQLASAVNAGRLAAGHAVVFTPDMGGLAGQRFLVVDANGVAGYQANEDYVMLLSGSAHPGALDAADFI